MCNLRKKSILGAAMCGFTAFVGVAGPLSAWGADAGGPEAKLKESLRAALIQARTLQSQKDQAETAKIEAEQKNEALTAELEALKTRATEEKEAADKAISNLKLSQETQAATISELQAALQDWKAAQKQAADLAAKKEADRLKLAGQAADLKKQTEDQRARNFEMYKIGMEVLSRYEGFGLGTAIRAREPFIGTMRVKFQNLVQDYADKLAEQKVK
jgi:hypothetical protein